MTIFKLGDFKSHSGKILPWKIECDALTQDDWDCVARMVADLVGRFSSVEGVPYGGIPLAAALEEYVTDTGPLLIVDDVMTTGNSMREHRDGREAIGAVLFARGPVLSWISPVFHMPAL